MRIYTFPCNTLATKRLRQPAEATFPVEATVGRAQGYLKTGSADVQSRRSRRERGEGEGRERETDFFFFLVVVVVTDV